jgi:hypothetical protein
MVDQLSENEILDYLMSSEFEEGLTPDEFKFLLKKFRNFYRVVSCSITNHKERMEQSIEELNSIKNLNKELENNFEIEKKGLETKIQVILDRKLSWKERFKGKIIIENENK